MNNEIAVLDVGRHKKCLTIVKSPSTRQLLDDLGGYVIALWVIATLIVLLLCGLLLQTTIFVNKSAPKRWRRKIVWINAVYPFVCLMCLCSLLVPASSSLLAAVGIIFMSNGVSKFIDLSLMYFGGETKMLMTVGEMSVPLAVPPVCCCCHLCCPHLNMSKRYLKAMKMLVQQLPFTQSAYCLLSLYLFMAELTSPGQIAHDDAYIYLTVFNVLSFMSAMYGLIMFLRVAKGKLGQYHYTAKSILMKATLVIVKLQDIIFNIAVNYGGVPTTRSMSPKVYGAFIRDVVVLLEMLLFGLLAHKLYNGRQQYQDAEDAVGDRKKEAEETDSDDD